jgi:hypothetical protein
LSVRQEGKRHALDLQSLSSKVRNNWLTL